ncbi:MAG: hypothetical protein VX447_18950 [Pseudomonadota bacterium]|uniref:toxin-antitoxin system YwqK family antitoxin n=1 Tax=Gallaecimonas pentaromativorans TaxID=584787 RepID=UPI00067ED201|nr:toxin-antitoxin system YwqK family antitoxin [Gallaecimonas pentaromativorans]MED5526810.1 hypothetical protein [Pseudomonadota bacterium]
MRFILMLLLPLALKVSAAQVWLDDHWNRTDPSQASFYLAEPLAEKDGRWFGTIYYKSSGQQRFVGSFDRQDINSAVAVGPYRYFHENGQLEAVGQRDSQGYINGVVSYYNSDGKLSREQHYVKDRQVGEEKQYGEGGQLVALRHYNSRGQLDGRQAYFWSSGKLRSETFYKSGKRDGTDKDWREDGSLSHETAYLAGRQHGESRSFDKRGTLVRVEHYQSGKRTGEQKRFYSSGVLSELSVYDSQGRLSQTRRFTEAGTLSYHKTLAYQGKNRLETEQYYKNGKLERRRQSDNARRWILVETFAGGDQPITRQETLAGRRQGLMLEQYTDFQGRRHITRSHYQNGERHGPYSESREGTMLAEGQYQQGNKVGTWHYHQQTLKTEHYNQAGELDGEVREQTPAGQLLLLAHYRRGQEHGQWLQYDEDGRLLGKGMMEKGLRTGEWVFQAPYEEAPRLWQGRYQAGKQVGKWQAKDEAGYLLGTAQYDQQGRPQGTFYRFAANGLLEEVSRYQDGELDGEQRRYSGGVLYSTEHYRQGVPVDEGAKPCPEGDTDCLLFGN